MKYQEIINKGSKILKLNNIKSFNLDSEILLSSSLKLNRSQLLLNLDKKINSEQEKIFFSLIKRRAKFEPIAYITGYKNFWKNKFKVNKNVLIPRPDTETLVEQVLKEIKIYNSRRILDIGTGSGCIILSILMERKKCYGVGLDISKKAINLAKYNAKIQQIKNRIKFYNSDIDNFCRGKYDLIVSNPPYINKHDLKYLERDVVNFEPRLALDGGLDGLSEIRKVIKKSSELIKKNGKFILEIGFDQRNKVINLLKQKGFYINSTLRDFANNDRCIICTKI